MSLHNDFNNLSNTLEKQYKRKLTKAEEREQQKERERIIKKIMFQNFTQYFESMKTLEEVKTLTKNFLKNKSNNIGILSEYLQDFTSKKATKNDIDFIEQNYNKIMELAKKERESLLKMEEEEEKEHAKELERLEKQEEEEKQKRELQKQAILKGIITTCQAVLIICALPFIIIFIFVLSICKNIK